MSTPLNTGIMNITARSLSARETATKNGCGKAAACALILLSLLGGCTHFGGNKQAGPGVLQNGSIGLSRPVPDVAALTDRQPLLGFVPTKHTQRPPRIELHRSSSQVIMITRDGDRRELLGSGIEQLPAGVYSVALKQRNPLWYAPASYFETRGLEVPAEGNKDRFRRGALGEYTVFLNNQAPLHSGPVVSADIGGVQLAESDLKAIFEAAEVGMTVEVF